MLSEELKKKELYLAICACGPDLIPGLDYTGLYICNAPSGAVPHENELSRLRSVPMHCIAKLNNNDMLISTADREYFFILRDGYADFGGTVYAINATIAAHFEHRIIIDGEAHEAPFPTEDYISSVIEGMKTEKCGMLAMMAKYHKRSCLELVLQGLKMERERNAPGNGDPQG